MTSSCGDCDCKPSKLDNLGDTETEHNAKSSKLELLDEPEPWLNEKIPSAPSNSSIDSDSEILKDCDESAKRIAAMTLPQKIFHYIKAMRMEPGFLLYMIASVMGNIMASDLLLDRACRVNMAYNETICDVLTATGSKAKFKAQETEVQKVISEIGIWSEVIENFFPITFSLFLGTWSDVYGVKLPFLFSIAGSVVRYGGLILCVYNPSWNAEIVSTISVLPVSITGGRIAISMVVYSFVSITSSLEERTVRVGILTAIRTFGRSAGSALGGLMKRSGKDYYFIFGIGGGIALLSFMYILIFMPNPKKGNNPCGYKDTKLQATKNLFNLRNITESAKAFFKKREFGIRTQLYLLVIVLIFTMAPMQGEDSVLLLFVREKLDWSTADYAYYGTFRMLIAFGGGIISVFFLATLLKMADWKLGVLSCVSQIAGSFVYAFATNSLMMYIAPVVDVLNGTMIIGARTMLSKISPIEEMGKINSFIAVIDSTTPLWGNPLYSAVYRMTIENFPGAFFLMSAAFTIPPMILFTYLGLTHKGIPIHEQAERKKKICCRDQPLPPTIDL